MKVVVIGLGNFGMALAVHLTESGNEVIAVDNDINKVEAIKEKVSHAIAFDATNENAYKALPLKTTDAFIIAIGGDEGAALMSSAIAKKLTEARVITRSSSVVQDTILEAMGIDQIIRPEQEYAERLTKKINLKGSIDNFEIDDDYLVSEVAVCSTLVGEELGKSGFRQKFNLNIITIIRKNTRKSILGQTTSRQEVLGTLKPSVIFQENDILVVFGKNSDIENYLKKHANNSHHNKA